MWENWVAKIWRREWLPTPVWPGEFQGLHSPWGYKESDTTEQLSLQFSSVQSLSLVRLFVNPWTTACQASLSITNSQSLPKLCPLSRWCHPTISSSVISFSFCLQSFPASVLFKWVSSSHQVVKVLESQLQHQSFQWIFRTDFLYDGLVGSPCSLRDSQESSPTPQFKSIDSLALSFLSSPTLTSVHDYWKNYSFD